MAIFCRTSKLCSFLQKNFFLLLLAAQFLFLCIATFFAGDQIIDGDTGRLYTHMEAIWNSGSLFVPDWIYPTTMELDCALLLALPFYGLTHDPVLSFSFASIVIIALWILLTFALAKRLSRNLSIRINGSLVCLLILIPYSTANLYYWNMMFLNGSQYAFKVMLPLLLTYLLLEPTPKVPSLRSLIGLAVYLFGLFLTALSSGIYVAALGIAPILLAFFLLWLYGRISLTPYHLACCVGSIISTFWGCSPSELWAWK